jgi:hypothetical protein
MRGAGRGCLLPAALLVAIELAVIAAATYVPAWALLLGSVALALVVAWCAGAQPLPRAPVPQ